MLAAMHRAQEHSITSKQHASDTRDETGFDKEQNHLGQALANLNTHIRITMLMWRGQAKDHTLSSRSLGTCCYSNLSHSQLAEGYFPYGLIF